MRAALLALTLMANCGHVEDLSDCANVCLKDIPPDTPTPPLRSSMVCEQISSLRYECFPR